MADTVHRGRGDEGQSAPDPDHETAHRRIDLSVRPTRHHVVEPTDLLSRLVPHRPTEQPRQRDDGVEDALGGEDAAGSAAALVRATVGQDAGGRRGALLGGEAGHGEISSARPSWGQDGPDGRRGWDPPGVSNRRLRPCGSRRRGSGHAERRVVAQPEHGWRHAPALLLGGSPLDMASPPSPPDSSAGCRPRGLDPQAATWIRPAAGRRGSDVIGDRSRVRVPSPTGDPIVPEAGISCARWT